MIKAILFDIDGVIIKKGSRRFSDELIVRGYGAPAEEIKNFFKGPFKLCQINKRDLKEELALVLPQWNWKAGVDSFLDFWFSNDREIDEEVLRKMSEFRKKYKLYLASQQEKYRAQYLLNETGLKNYVDGTFFSYEVEIQKGTPEFYQEILKRLELQPEEVAYVDDEQKNVEVANALGIRAKHYTKIEDLDMLEA